MNGNILTVQQKIPEEALRDIYVSRQAVDRTMYFMRQEMGNALYERFISGNSKLHTVGIHEDFYHSFDGHTLTIRAEVNPVPTRHLEVLEFDKPIYSISQQYREWLCLYCGSVNRTENMSCMKCNASRTWVMK